MRVARAAGDEESRSLELRDALVGVEAKIDPIGNDQIVEVMYLDNVVIDVEW